MFKKYEVESHILTPNRFWLDKIKTEIRIDPLTGDTVRITVPRFPDPPFDTQNGQYLNAIAESEKECPFCADRLDSLTPRFPPEIHPEGRIVHESSILIPNLFPYDRYSGVAIFSSAHFTEIGNFRPEEYIDAFINIRDYLRNIFASDHDLRSSAVTQNYLPSSGGTLIHPHLQVNAFSIAPNYLNRLYIASRNYYIEKSHSFWEKLIEAELKAGERVVHKEEGIIWLTPFAPRGFLETWAIFEKLSDFRDAGGYEIVRLAHGILKIQNYYRAMGKNSFNFGIYSIRDTAISYRMLLRMVARTNFYPFARNDQSYFEVILGEGATDKAPEQIARELKEFFK